MNMKLLLFAFVLLLFSGCSGEEMENGGHAAGLKDVKVNLTFAISDGDSLVTRSIAFMPEGKKSVASDTVSVLTKASLVDENLISTLWVGQYDLSGNLLVSQYLTNITGNQVNFQLKESPECSLRFVANAGDLGKISTLADFNVKKVTYAAGNTCPMFGFLDKQYVSVSYSPSVTMERMLAHIQLAYKIDPGFSFTVKSVSIKSIPVQMQCVEPAGQISGMTYQDISGTVSQSGATVDWYIPENKAGVIKSGEAGFATTDRGKCGGATVPNATYIEIVGDAIVKGVTYAGVTFRMYPGNEINDYTIKRNSPYKVNLTLSGIDFSDPRVSVVVPDIVAPKAIDAAIDSTTTMLVTVRPGVAWSITLPDWLSVLLDGKDAVSSSETINRNGPAQVLFKAVSANPNAKDRQISFDMNVNGTNQNIAVIQKGSEFTAAGATTKITKEDKSTAVGSITATAGLKWTVSSETNNGIIVKPTSGSGDAELTFTASANTGAERLDSFIVSVVGADPVRKVTVKAIQEAGTNVVTINNAIVESFKKSGDPGSNYAIFKYDGGSTGSQGADLNGISQTRTLTKEYIIEVEKIERGSTCANYAAAISYCKNKSEGWRVPTLIELYAMYENQTTLLKNGVAAFKKNDYWSSSPHRGSAGERSIKNFADGHYDYWNIVNASRYVRCVREKNM